MNWNIGCSGFSNPNWIGYFYPEELSNKEWLEFYAQHFDTLELNTTFYKMPTSSLLTNLYNRTPVDFCFVIKAPKLITHTQKFFESENLLRDFYSVLKINLKEKLGAVLFQLPPSFSYSEERLELLVNSLDSDFMNVIEFRNSSWWKDFVYKKLAMKNICFSGLSYPGLPDEVVINTEFAYYRFHGVPKLYYSMYSNSFLTEVYQTFQKNSQLKQGYLLFNNTASRAALENASYLQALISL